MHLVVLRAQIEPHDVLKYKYNTLSMPTSSFTYDDLALVEIELHLRLVKVLDHKQSHHAIVGQPRFPVLRWSPTAQIHVHFFAKLEDI